MAAQGSGQDKSSDATALLESARQRTQRLHAELAGQRQQFDAMPLSPQAVREGRAALEQAIAASERLLAVIEAELHQR